MNTTKLLGWYCRSDGRIGSYDVQTEEPSYEEKWNATQIYNSLVTGQGWTLNSVAGMLGNMQNESSINPALIEATHRGSLPDAGHTIELLTNSVMKGFFNPANPDLKGYAIGLIQWDSTTTQAGITSALIPLYADNRGTMWYDGNLQVTRLIDEHDRNLSWTSARVSGIEWTNWTTFTNGTADPEIMATVFALCRERNADPYGEDRRRNARWWYNYFEHGPQPLGGFPIWLLANKKKRGVKYVKFV